MKKLFKQFAQWLAGDYQFWKKEAESGYLLKEQLTEQLKTANKFLEEVRVSVRKKEIDPLINGETYFVFTAWKFIGVATYIDNGKGFKAFQKIQWGYAGEIYKTEFIEADEWFLVTPKIEWSIESIEGIGPKKCCGRCIDGVDKCVHEESETDHTALLQKFMSFSLETSRTNHEIFYWFIKNLKYT